MTGRIAMSKTVLPSDHFSGDVVPGAVHVDVSILALENRGAVAGDVGGTAFHISHGSSFVLLLRLGDAAGGESSKLERRRHDLLSGRSRVLGRCGRSGDPGVQPGRRIGPGGGQSGIQGPAAADQLFHASGARRGRQGGHRLWQECSLDANGGHGRAKGDPGLVGTEAGDRR
jgi:hypothetical protein